MPLHLSINADADRLDVEDVREVLELCRSDLAAVRSEAEIAPICATPAPLDHRLGQIVNQLDRATASLNEMLDAAKRAAAIASGVLAQEADHRIRNSLQVLASLLKRQASLAPEPAVKDALALASVRVCAFSAVHAMLHADGATLGVGGWIDLAGYLDGLCETMREAFGLDGVQRSLLVQVEPHAVASEAARSIGLIVTELVTNALRHALPHQQAGAVRVHGALLPGSGGYRLCVEDDGTGLPADFDLRFRPSGLGLRLVNMLTDQLRARIVADRNIGARFQLTLPLAR